MRSRTIYDQLIDYAEGTLPETERKSFEEILFRTPELQKEYALLQDTFTLLSTVPEPEIPKGYFSQLMTSLRKRLDTPMQPQWYIPGFLIRYIAPVTAILVIITIYNLYFLFSPSFTLSFEQTNFLGYRWEELETYQNSEYNNVFSAGREYSSDIDERFTQGLISSIRQDSVADLRTYRWQNEDFFASAIGGIEYGDLSADELKYILAYIDTQSTND